MLSSGAVRVCCDADSWCCGQAATWAACTGLGLALVFPASQSLVADMFAPEKRGRAFGTLMTIAALSGMAGSFFSIQMGGMHFGHTAVCCPVPPRFPTRNLQPKVQAFTTCRRTILLCTQVKGLG